MALGRKALTLMRRPQAAEPATQYGPMTCPCTPHHNGPILIRHRGMPRALRHRLREDLRVPLRKRF